MMVDDNKIHAAPVKSFFINMITKDISLEDCILDLIDNCIDGANRQIRNNPNDAQNKYKGYWAELTVNKDELVLHDNCGGITLSDAIDYAFHFGRKKDAPPEAKDSIGLYGIGMKRAIFKTGRHIVVESQSQQDSFKVTIDVEEWEKEEENWDFEYEDIEGSERYGTTIKVTQLHDYVSEEFEDEIFLNKLKKSISRDYSFLMSKGFNIKVNNTIIKPFLFKLRFGVEMKPIRYNYTDEETGVGVSIVTGLADSPPDDIGPDIDITEAEYYGWYVVCNDRVVLAGNKDDKTVWGNEGFTRWHNQYYGFVGIVFFHHSTEPGKLPWTTTKRDIDQTSKLYNRALVRMKEYTKPFTLYTGRRRDNIDEAKKAEANSEGIEVKQLEINIEAILPSIVKDEKIKLCNIQYKKPCELVEKVKTSLGDNTLSNREVGTRTFEYFVERELSE